jgi:hypothetical protein
VSRRRNGGGGGAAAGRRAGSSGLGQCHPRGDRFLSRGGKRRREWRGDQAAEGVPRLPDQAQACRLRRRRRGALVSPLLSSKSTFFVCVCASVQFSSSTNKKKSGFFPFVSWGKEERVTLLDLLLIISSRLLFFSFLSIGSFCATSWISFIFMNFFLWFLGEIPFLEILVPQIIALFRPTLINKMK